MLGSDDPKNDDSTAHLYPDPGAKIDKDLQPAKSQSDRKIGEPHPAPLSCDRDWDSWKPSHLKGLVLRSLQPYHTAWFFGQGGSSFAQRP